MNVDKMVTSGNGPYVTLALKTYYMKDGSRFDKAPEKPYDAMAEIGLELTIPDNLLNTGDDIRDLACKHSYTRKAQEHFQAVIRSDGDIQEAADGFADVYAKLMKGERDRASGGTVKVDSTETLAIRKLAAILRAKNADGNVPADFPRAADPPLTEKGIVNYNAWAKVAKAEGHKWYATALKLVSSDKGFD